MTSLPADALLLLIDVQQGGGDPAWGPRNNPACEANLARLLGAWRETGREIRASSQPSAESRELRAESESRSAPKTVIPHVRRSQLSALGSQPSVPRQRGLTTNHCVSTTTRMAGNLGFTTLLVADGCATFDRRGPDGVVRPAELVHAVALGDLHGELAEVVSTAELLAAAVRP